MIAVVRLLLLAAALTFGVRSHARADGVHVDTQVDPCVPIDRERFVYLLGIELGAAQAAPTESAATLTLSCSDNLIQLSVQDALTRKVASRSVDITTVEPNDRERLMALTASELVMASFLDVGMESRAAPPPPEQPVSKVVTPRAPAAPPLRLGADLTTAAFLSALAPVFGLALHVSLPFSSSWPSWSWNVSLLGGRGSLDGTLGAANQQVAVSVTTAAIALSARYTRRVAALDLWGGLAGLVGMAYLKGSPAGMLNTTPAYGPWAGPALQLGAAYPVSQRVRILLQLEAGVLLLGTRALVGASSNTNTQEHVVTELRGGWLGANLGFDCAL